MRSRRRIMLVGCLASALLLVGGCYTEIDPAEPQAAQEAQPQPQDPVDPLTGEHRFLNRDLLLGAAVDPAAHFGVFALVVLAHDAEVDLARPAVGERRANPLEQLERP